MVENWCMKKQPQQIQYLLFRETMTQESVEQEQTRGHLLLVVLMFLIGMLMDM
jgi:hypothetical protein